MQGFLDPFVVRGVRHLQRLMAQVIMVGKERDCREGGGRRRRHMSSRKENVALEWTHIASSSSATSGVCSASRRDNASTTVLSRPRRYSIVKSNPNNLLIHYAAARWTSAGPAGTSD
jgi:hypothetical protein